MDNAQLAIDAAFPGGNILLNRIEGDTVFVEQELRGTTIWWFYWQFRVRHAQGRALTFTFTDDHMPEGIRGDQGHKFNNGSPIGTRGPAVSLDQGATWAWVGADSVTERSFRYRFGPDQADVRFCFSLPYLEANLQSFLARHRGNALLSVGALCVTRKGRTVERVHLQPAGRSPAHRVLLTARHHCCEMIASYAVEGLLRAVLTEPDTDWLRRNVEFLLIPFVDKDGVEDGDQGKSRAPRDHNRDYDGESVHDSTRALRQFVPAWAEGRLCVAADIHCPTIRGPHNENIYMVGAESPAVWEEQRRFGRILESVRRGPLPYVEADNLPFGQSWNKPDNFASGKSFAQWAAELEGMRLATSFEIPYANVKGQTVTADAARAFGADLARAIQTYLRPSA